MYKHTEPIDSISDTLCLKVYQGVHKGTSPSSFLDKENVPLLEVPRSELLQSNAESVKRTKSKVEATRTDSSAERATSTSNNTLALSPCSSEIKEMIPTTTAKANKKTANATSSSTSANGSDSATVLARSALTDVTSQFSNRLSKVHEKMALREVVSMVSRSQGGSGQTINDVSEATCTKPTEADGSLRIPVTSTVVVKDTETTKPRVQMANSNESHERNLLRDQGEHKETSESDKENSLTSSHGSGLGSEPEREQEGEEGVDSNSHSTISFTRTESEIDNETGAGSDTEPTSVYSFESEKNPVVDTSDANDSLDDKELNVYSAVEADDTNSKLINPIQFSFEEDTQQLLQQARDKYYREDPDPADDDTYDIAMVPEFANDIFEYMKELEVKYRPNPNYMHYQRELRWSYRRVLLDWIVEVHQSLQLLPETLYLTVNIIDRFLSKAGVLLSRFQLVGAASLFIAAKYEEINCPSLKDMVYMLNNAYTKEEIIEAEEYIIITLDFEISWPGPMSFLRRVSKADDYEYEVRTLAKYLLESAIMDSRLVSVVPSWLAAAAYFLSKVILGHQTWSLKHIYYSGYTQEQILPLATTILENCRDAENRHKAIFKKYSQSQYLYASQVVAKWIASAEEKVDKSSSKK